VKQYKYFLFDWDGTLAKALDIWLESMKDALAKKGQFLNDADIGANYDKFKNRFESQGYKKVKIIVDEGTSLANSRIPNIELYEDSREVLEFLYNHGAHLALVTTSTHSQIDHLLKKHSLVSLFDVVVCGDDVSNIKSNPEPILKAIDDLGAKFEETIMIGDSESDIKASTNAKIDSVLFYPPSHDKFHILSELKLLEPSYVIHKLPQLMTLISD
jgi:pyrophosphatase PpaX